MALHYLGVMTGATELFRTGEGLFSDYWEDHRRRERLLKDGKDPRARGMRESSHTQRLARIAPSTHSARHAHIVIAATAVPVLSA